VDIVGSSSADTSPPRHPRNPTKDEADICIYPGGKVEEAVTECPICLEEMMTSGNNTEKRRMAVASCGHVFCRECVESHMGIAGKNGTPHNLAAWALRLDPKHVRCPLCRCKDAFLHGWLEV